MESRLLRLILLILALELTRDLRHRGRLRTTEATLLLLPRKAGILLLKTLLRRSRRLGLHWITSVLLLELRLLLLLSEASRLRRKGTRLSTKPRSSERLLSLARSWTLAIAAAQKGVGIGIHGGGVVERRRRSGLEERRSSAVV